MEEERVKFKKKTDGSRKFYVGRLSRSSTDFLTESIDKYFERKEEFSKEPLSEIFLDQEVQIEKDPESEKSLNVKGKEIDPKRVVVKNYLITGFDKSFYKYNHFDSKQEHMLAYQLEYIGDVDFWVRNMGDYWLEYGVGNRYHPDFVVKTDAGLYVVEVKGELYLETARTKREREILEKLRKEDSKALLLIHSDIEGLCTIINSIFVQECCLHIIKIDLDSKLEHLVNQRDDIVSKAFE